MMRAGMLGYQNTVIGSTVPSVPLQLFETRSARTEDMGREMKAGLPTAWHRRLIFSMTATRQVSGYSRPQFSVYVSPFQNVEEISCHLKMTDANGSITQATANLHLDEVTGERRMSLLFC